MWSDVLVNVEVVASKKAETWSIGLLVVAKQAFDQMRVGLLWRTTWL